MAEEMVERLGRMRRAMAKLLREGREREFAAVSLAYEVLKRQQVGRPEREQHAVPRVVQRPRELGEAERWRRAIRGRYGSGMTATIWRPSR